MVTVSLGHWMLYLCACVCCRWLPCQATKFFVECYDCTAQGSKECYGSKEQCIPGTNAFYCYTFYETEGGEQEKGCTTDTQLASWLVDPLEGTRECKDTVNGTKICYCQNDIQACPLDSTTSDPEQTATTSFSRSEASSARSSTSAYSKAEKPLDTSAVPKRTTPKRTVTIQPGTSVTKSSRTEKSNLARFVTTAAPSQTVGVGVDALSSSSASLGLIAKAWLWILLLTVYMIT